MFENRRSCRHLRAHGGESKYETMQRNRARTNRAQGVPTKVAGTINKLRYAGTTKKVDHVARPMDTSAKNTMPSAAPCPAHRRQMRSSSVGEDQRTANAKWLATPLASALSSIREIRRVASISSTATAPNDKPESRYRRYRERLHPHNGNDSAAPTDAARCSPSDAWTPIGDDHYES